MISSKKYQLSVVVGARWGTEMGGSYPFFRFDICSDKLTLYSRLSLFSNRPSCTILKDNILEIKRLKSCFSGKGLKIIHNDFRHPALVVVFFGRSKDVLNTENMLNNLHYPIDLNSEREQLKISKILKEITTYGDGSSKSAKKLGG